jgi:TIR domain
MTAAWKRRCGSPASTGADLSGAGKILDEIDTAIRLRDKVLLILSDHSIKSDWVEDEVKTAYEEERKRGQTVLSPWRGRTWPGTPWLWVCGFSKNSGNRSGFAR